MKYEINGSVLNLGISLANSLNPYALIKIEDEMMRISAINAERTTKSIFFAKLDAIEPRNSIFALNVKFAKNLLSSMTNRTITLWEEEETERIVLETASDVFKLPKMDPLVVGEEQEITLSEEKLQISTPVADLIRILNNFKEIEKTFTFRNEDGKVFVSSVSESFDLKSQIDLKLPVIDREFDPENIRFNARLFLPTLSILRQFDATIRVGELLQLDVESEIGDFTAQILLAPIQEMDDLDALPEEYFEALEDEAL